MAPSGLLWCDEWRPPFATSTQRQQTAKWHSVQYRLTVSSEWSAHDTALDLVAVANQVFPVDTGDITHCERSLDAPHPGPCRPASAHWSHRNTRHWSQSPTAALLPTVEEELVDSTLPGSSSTSSLLFSHPWQNTGICLDSRYRSTTASRQRFRGRDVVIPDNEESSTPVFRRQRGQTICAALVLLPLSWLLVVDRFPTLGVPVSAPTKLFGRLLAEAEGVVDPAVPAVAVQITPESVSLPTLDRSESDLDVPAAGLASSPLAGVVPGTVRESRRGWPEEDLPPNTEEQSLARWTAHWRQSEWEHDSRTASTYSRLHRGHRSSSSIRDWNCIITRRNVCWLFLHMPEYSDSKLSSSHSAWDALNLPLRFNCQAAWMNSNYNVFLSPSSLWELLFNSLHIHFKYYSTQLFDNKSKWFLSLFQVQKHVAQLLYSSCRHSFRREY